MMNENAPNKSTIKPILIIAAIILLVSLTIFFVNFPTEKITPDQWTYTAIDETFNRIFLYIKKHDAYPRSLEELPDRKNYLNKITDAWGQKFVYEIKDDRYVTLTSLGKDGRSGGTGDNKDISETLPLRKEDGSRWTNLNRWREEIKKE